MAVIVPKYRRGDVMRSKDGRSNPQRVLIEMVGTESYFIRHLTGFNWAEPVESCWGFPGLEAEMELEHHDPLPELEGFLHADTIRTLQRAMVAHMEADPEEGTLALLGVVSGLLEPSERLVPDGA